MSFDQLIHEYLDSGLDDTRQEALFAEISRNPEVRNEFNTQMKLQSLAREDMSSIVPPTFVTKNVFGKLGFTPPLSHGAVDKVSKFALLKNGWFIAGITAFLSFSLSYLIIPTFDSNGESNTNDLASITKSDEFSSNKVISEEETEKTELNTKAEYISASDYNNLNVRTDESILESRLNDSKPEETKFSLSSFNNFDSNYDSKGFFSDLVTSIQDGLSEVNLSIASNNVEESNTSMVSMNNVLSQNPINTISLNQSTNLNSFNIDSSRWSVNWRMINSSSALSSNIPNSTNPLLNNTLGIYYKLSKGHFLAFEFGLEQLDQTYFETVTGNRINVTQRPESFWYSLAYKYRSSDFSLYESIYPFVQVNAGASQFGPMARSQIGFEIIPITNSPFLLYASYEASNFWYFAGNNSFDTFNKGFSFGFSYNF